MLPRPSICLHIPKTGSAWVDWFFNAADWLEFRRSLGIRRLALPGRASLELVRRIKRHGSAFGNLNCRTGDHHTGYAAPPDGLRPLPKLAVLRDLEGWYASFHLYYTGVMKRTLLDKAVRRLVHGEDRRLGASAREALLANRDAFRARWAREDAAARAGGPVSVGFLLWFQHAVWRPALVHRILARARPRHGLRGVLPLAGDAGRFGRLRRPPLALAACPDPHPGRAGARFRGPVGDAGGGLAAGRGPDRHALGPPAAAELAVGPGAGCEPGAGSRGAAAPALCGGFPALGICAVTRRGLRTRRRAGVQRRASPPRPAMPSRELLVRLLRGVEAPGHGLLALATLVPGAWAAGLVGASAIAGLGRREPAAVLMPAVLATIHLAWAAGFLAGAHAGGGRERA